MSVVKSQLLEKILAESTAFSDDKTITAERFVLAAVTYVNANKGSSDAKQLETVLGGLNLPLDVLESCLRNAIQSRKPMFSDSTYMNGMLNTSMKKAEDASKPELTADMLLKDILDLPSGNLSRVIKEAHKRCDGAPAAGSDGISGADGFNNGFFEAAKEVSLTDAAPEGDTEQKPVARRQLTREEVNDAIVTLTKDMAVLRDTILEDVKGQYNAVSRVVEGIFRAEYRDLIGEERKGPKAIFLFAGPPGVGKSFLAEALGKALKRKSAVFDMSEFTDKDATQEFNGSDKVWRDSHVGKVTSFAKENPDAILVFDEIEKAHRNTIMQFLQILDGGRLRDRHLEEEISFKDNVIVMTTNAGKTLYEDSETGDFSDTPDKTVVDALLKDIDPETKNPYFPAPICSRLATGSIVMFNRMFPHVLREIAQEKLEKHIRKIIDATGLEIEVDPDIYNAMILEQGGKLDARVMSSKSSSFLDNEINELNRLLTERGDSLLRMKKIKITMDLDGADESIMKMFGEAVRYTAMCFAPPEITEKCRWISTNTDIIGVHSYDECVRVLAKQNIGMVLLDMRYKTQNNGFLNIEDEISEPRSLYAEIKSKYPEMPVYLLIKSDDELSHEDIFSFMRRGIRGIISCANSDVFNEEMIKVGRILHQQESVRSLSRANKVLSYETAQLYDKNTDTAEIRLFDFKTATAVDAEDLTSIVSDITRPTETFEDVLGAKDAKRELQFFVDYIKKPEMFEGTGIPIPKGILLYGPPGTGKTKLAKAMAHEADATFIAMTGSQFFASYVGESEANMKKAFAQARKYAPTILFIDEIDAIAKRRTGHGGAEENVLTTFLAEMDGFKTNPKRPVFVLAATNMRPDKPGELDEAVLRRFNRCILVDLPGREDRLKYLTIRRDKSPLFTLTDEELESFAVRSSGMSIAKLEQVCDAALKNAVLDGSRGVTKEVFDEAFETAQFGEERTNVSPEMLLRIARHEAGHTYLYWKMGKTPSYVTVVARGDHGGYMRHDDEREQFGLQTRDELLGEIRVSLGGRAAEIVYYDDGGFSTGAGADLHNATLHAKHMICSYGMDEKYGLAVIDADKALNDVNSEIRTAVNEILASELYKAVNEIRDGRAKIDMLVDELLRSGHLNGEEITSILEG